MELNKDMQPHKELCAVCGLFCGSCSLYIGTVEDPARLQWLAERFGKPIEEVRCLGCRSEVVTEYCRNCKFTSCAAAKGIDFCSQCSEYPCTELQEFQAQMPHRSDLWEDLKRVKEVGYEKWFCEKASFYACPECETINSAYDLKCRKCGHEPGSKFVERHGNKVRDFWNKQKSE